MVIASVETYLKYAKAIGLTSSAAAPAYKTEVNWLVRREVFTSAQGSTSPGAAQPLPFFTAPTEGLKRRALAY